MKTKDLFLRCYVEKKHDVWQGFCLEFCLAVQGDSPQEVREKLEAMISEYVYDAVIGEDREFAYELLNRRAPLPQWLKYYFYAFAIRCMHLKNDVTLFMEPYPHRGCQPS